MVNLNTVACGALHVVDQFNKRGSKSNNSFQKVKFKNYR